jgi:hypothetical protein
VIGIGKCLQVEAQFGQQMPRHDPVHARYGDQWFGLAGIWFRGFGYASFKQCHFLPQELVELVVGRQHRAVKIVEATLRRFLDQLLF